MSLYQKILHKVSENGVINRSNLKKVDAIIAEKKKKQKWGENMKKIFTLCAFAVFSFCTFSSLSFAESLRIEASQKITTVEIPSANYINLSIEDNRVKAIRTLASIKPTVDSQTGGVSFALEESFNDGDVFPLTVKSETGDIYEFKIKIDNLSNVDNIIIEKKAIVKRVKNANTLRADAKIILKQILNNQFDNIGIRELTPEELDIFGLSKDNKRVVKYDTENFTIFKCKCKKNYNPQALRLKNSFLTAAISNEEAIIFQLKKNFEG